MTPTSDPWTVLLTIFGAKFTILKAFTLKGGLQKIATVADIDGSSGTAGAVI